MADACVTVLPGPVGAAILARVASVLGARAGLGGGRVADLVRLTDAVAGCEPIRDARVARVEFTARPGELALAIGPVASGRADELRHASAGAPSHDIEHLADAVSAVEESRGTSLHVAIRE